MATFDVAYIKEQGQDVIIVVVSPAVGNLSLPGNTKSTTRPKPPQLLQDSPAQSR